MLNKQINVASVMSAVIGLMASAGAISQTRGGFAEMLQLPAVVKPAIPQVRPAQSCEKLLNTRPSMDATVREAQVIPGNGNMGEWCRVTIEIAPPSSPHIITAWLGLPISDWNGRFLGLGGGGWVPGFPPALAEGVSRGFATAITNAGRPYDLSANIGELARNGQSDFLLDANGRLDWTALQNFAYRGIHEMTVAGKAVASQFYGVPPRYAYFTGCSTGGRQGQSEVQRYPYDYDGVLSGAPVINWAHFAAVESWHQAVEKDRSAVAQCKFDAAHRTAVEACDADDGAKDDLVSGVNTCRFEANRLIGMQTACGVIDKQDAEVIGLVWEGPRRRDGTPLWNGIDRAALIHPPFVPPKGVRSPFADGKTVNPDNLSMATFESMFDEFVERYGMMDTSDPNLGMFAKHGGKTILWHGIADDGVPAAGSVRYVESIRRTLGSSTADKFLRLYLAPGVGHCQGGNGPQPVALLEPLMEWVEHGRPPSQVRSENWNDAGVATRTRPLCPYPEYARYRGQGSLDDAANFRCQK